MAHLHDARAIANVLIEKGQRDGRLFDPLQIAKLVYLCHSWMLGLHGRGLIRQNIYAWQYGPVVPRLYHSLKKYKSAPVTEPIKGIESADLDRPERDIIEQVYGIYGDFTGIQLSHITHEDGTPWDITWSTKGRDSVIPDELIKQHYEELYDEWVREESAAYEASDHNR